MLPSSNFDEKKNIANQQNYSKIAQNVFSTVRYSPFPLKVDFDDVLWNSNIPNLWTKSCCVTIQINLFSFWVCEVMVRPIKWKLLSSSFLLYCLFSLSWAVQIVQTLESVNENLSCDQFCNFLSFSLFILVSSVWSKSFSVTI